MPAKAKSINLVYTFNDKFIPQSATSICSVCENNKKNLLNFYILSKNISAKNQALLKDLVASYGQKIHIIEIGDISQYLDFDFDTASWDSIVLARLFLDKLLPKSVEQVLYIDGDTIVRGSLSKLWQTNLGDNILAASLELTARRQHRAELGIPNFPYCNAGVLLIDLKKWRQEQTGSAILDYYRHHNGQLFYNDQDAINVVLAGRIYLLPPKYNFCSIYHQYPYYFLKKLAAPTKYFSKHVFTESRKRPIIIHFLGEERPWRAGNFHRFRHEYKKYLSLTPWADTPDEQGWRTYFIFFQIFNTVTRPFPALRSCIVDSLIPTFFAIRNKRKK